MFYETVYDLKWAIFAHFLGFIVGKLSGWCVMASMIHRWLIPSFNALRNNIMIDTQLISRLISVETWSTLDSQSVDSCPSVNRPINIKWKLVDCWLTVLIACEPRSQRVERGSIKGTEGHSTADAFSIHDTTFSWSWVHFVQATPLIFSMNICFDFDHNHLTFWHIFGISFTSTPLLLRLHFFFSLYSHFNIIKL